MHPSLESFVVWGQGVCTYFYRLLANFYPLEEARGVSPLEEARGVSPLEEARGVYVLTEGPRFLFPEVWARNAPAHQWLDAQWGVGCSQLAAGSPAMSFVLLPQWPLGVWGRKGFCKRGACGG